MADAIQHPTPRLAENRSTQRWPHADLIGLPAMGLMCTAVSGTAIEVDGARPATGWASAAISSSRAMSHALTFGGPTGTVSKGRILALSSDSKVSTQTSEDEKKCTQRRCRRSDCGVFAREHALQVYIHVRKQTQVYVRTDNYEEKDGAIHHL